MTSNPAVKETRPSSQYQGSLLAPVKDWIRLLQHSRERIHNHDVYASAITGKKGLEVGGPSRIFKTILPLYHAVDSLDGANFSGKTIWEGAIESGSPFNYFGNKVGTQFIAEATDLHCIDSHSYDFVLSSNCLEHSANPIKALIEWKRVLKNGGALILILPNKDSNFDHNRPVTPFEHLMEDYRNDTTEHDLTHLEEILALHDLSMDPWAGSIENFKQRSMNNFENRALHQHVFSMDVMKSMLEFCGFKVVATTVTHSDFFALARN